MMFLAAHTRALCLPFRQKVTKVTLAQPTLSKSSDAAVGPIFVGIGAMIRPQRLQCRSLIPLYRSARLNCRPPIPCRTFALSTQLAKSNDAAPHRETLLLPQTPFALRANAKVREKLFRPRTTEALYKWQSETRKGSSDVWFLQDGPPYANGDIHMGHALNKVLKDITNRYHVLKGKRVYYKAGWDVHGLPIESKVVGSEALTGKTPNQRDLLEVRRLAHEYAQGQISQQRQEMESFGIMTNWQDYYKTDAVAYEAKQLEIFAEIASKGLIYRATKPVHWSPWSQTAMAEAELEYDENYTSASLYVLFKFEASQSLLDAMPKEAQQHLVNGDVDALIWTTTPWSLPGNMAMAVNPDMSYSLVEMQGDHPFKGLKIWVATERIQWLSERKVGLPNKDRPLVGEMRTLAQVQGRDLLGSKYRSPLQSVRSPSRPIYDASFVTEDAGTGLVHVAPAHGLEDYELCVSKGLVHPATRSQHDDPSATYLELSSPLDHQGKFTAEVAHDNAALTDLVDKSAFGEGSNFVTQHLWDTGRLLSSIHIKHKYPMDWRARKPVLVRATKQWFINIESLKDKAKAALAKVKFIPESSRARLENIVGARQEWCISRQRAWGVPIPVVYDVATDEPLLTRENVAHIASVLQQRGTSYWWQGDAEEFVAPQYRDTGKQWRKGLDTMDVWFDSGVAWAASQSSPAGAIADLYVEGTDQHRGWFQSSLLTKLASDPHDAEPTAPYKAIATHGFVMDKKGQKMSKSIGNVIVPRQIILGDAKEPGLGTDVLRYWAAKTAVWESDPRFSHLISKHAGDDLRAYRTTARFLLGCLPPAGNKIPDLADADVQSHVDLLDRFILHELRELEVACAEAYQNLDYPTIARKTLEFDSKVLSPLYLDIIKDTLYAESVHSPQRIAKVAVVDQILKTTTTILSPIVPHLAEEIWHYRSGASKDPLPDESPNDVESFFHGGWRGVEPQWHDAASHAKMQRVWELRSMMMKMIEEARSNQWAKKLSEVQVTVQLDSAVKREDLVEEDAQLLDVIAESASTGQLTHWLQLASVHGVERVAGEVLAREPTSEDAASWSLSSLRPLRCKDGGREVASGGLRFVMRASEKEACPRCRFHRSEAANVACTRCRTVMAEMGREVGG